MTSTLKNALKGGVVVGGGLMLLLTAVAFVFFPIGVALLWVYGYMSFEAAAMILLVFISYSCGGGGGGD